jgi:hypothetical protein
VHHSLNTRGARRCKQDAGVVNRLGQAKVRVVEPYSVRVVEHGRALKQS